MAWRIVRDGDYWIDAVRITRLREALTVHQHPALDVAMLLCDAIIVLVIHPQIFNSRQDTLEAVASIEEKLPLEIALHGRSNFDEYLPDVKSLHRLGEALVNDHHPMAELAVQICATLSSIILTPEAATAELEELRQMLNERRK